MSDFYKKFLTEDVPKVTPGTNKQIFLGAFGKHPGWDDHVEDLGLETGSLIQAKILFYVQGIGGEIDGGAWEKLDEAQRLPDFKHVFVWHRPGQLLVGRLWSSSDGKGRTRYPMVVCAHCSGVALSWALDQVLPRLEQIERECVATQSAADVRSLLARYRTELRNAASGQMTDLGPPTLDTAFITKFAARPELGPQQEGWMRLLYAVQNQFSAFAKGRFNPKADPSTIRPQQVRAPRAADSVSVALLQWTNFFLTQVDPQTPMLLTAPLEHPWIDVTLGQPGRQEVFCLRATPKAVPPASEVPYNLTDNFRSDAKSVLSALEVGRPPGSILTAGSSTPIESTSSGPQRKGLFKWFGAAVLFLIAAAGAFWLVSSQKQDGTNSAERPVAAPNEVVASARPAGGVTTPAAVNVPARDPAPLSPEPEAKSIADEKRAAEEKVKADAAKEAARLKVLAEEQEKEKARLAVEAEAKRAAEERRLAEEKRMAEQKARTEVATLNPDARRAATPQPAQPATRSDTPVQGTRTNGIGMIMVPIPSGYWVGKYEVTQAEFEKVMSRNPSAYKSPLAPVENVNADEAQEFCQRLTSLENSVSGLQKGWAYTLPTEAQWTEFVADADLSGAVTSNQRPQKRVNPEPVGSTKLANRFGLYDVRGNVWEWCVAGDQRVLKGGAYDAISGLAGTLSLQFRWALPPDTRKPQAGFRCVLAKQP